MDVRTAFASHYKPGGDDAPKRAVSVRYMPRTACSARGVDGRNLGPLTPVQAAAAMLFDLEIDPRDCHVAEVQAGPPCVALVHRAAGALRSGRVVALVTGGLSLTELNLALMTLAGAHGPCEPHGATRLADVLGEAFR